MPMVVNGVRWVPESSPTVAGVSPRSVDDLVAALGAESGISKCGPSVRVRSGT